ncbi:hypothetical protein M378DRAFT_537598 [Amanita muscaria Koide BX008]|uniref:Uncharacterized protein n=1 Tax=Amanita muscaria (strain Koide BX008) TaxID=946122 RepID=A0A0C2SPX2_AMAMK|nr:hypothetical protein M378DRAFT_537598 [Amanita muscaria Koide BX008]
MSNSGHYPALLLRHPLRFQTTLVLALYRVQRLWIRTVLIICMPKKGSRGVRQAVSVASGSNEL